MSEHTQPLREFKYLLASYNNAKSPVEKENFVDKINNWKRSHPNTWQVMLKFEKAISKEQ